MTAGPTHQNGHSWTLSKWPNLSIFKTAFPWEDFYGENTARKAKCQRNNLSRTRYLDQTEIFKFLSCCDSRLVPVILTAILTGMRKQEILGLRWENIDFNRSTMNLTKTKSGKPRMVPISPKLREILLRMVPDKEGSVFHLSEITFRRLFGKAREEAGLLHFVFHDLRRTFGTHFISKTQDLNSLRTILGHSTLQMTQRYLGVIDGVLHSGVAMVDSVVPEMTDIARDCPTLLGVAVPLVGHQLLLTEEVKCKKAL